MAAALAGYTWLKTGRIGLWPKPASVEEQRLWDTRRDLKETEKRIGKLKASIALGLPGTPRADMEEEVRALEQQAAAMRERIEKLEAEVRRSR